MAFKPDYGMLRMREGFSPDADLFFYDLRMFSLTVLGRGEYSTTVDMEFGGQTYCLSLDFSHAQLKQILAKTPGVAPLVNAAGEEEHASRAEPRSCRGWQSP